MLYVYPELHSFLIPGFGNVLVSAILFEFSYFEVNILLLASVDPTSKPKIIERLR